LIYHNGINVTKIFIFFHAVSEISLLKALLTSLPS